MRAARLIGDACSASLPRVRAEPAARDRPTRGRAPLSPELLAGGGDRAAVRDRERALARARSAARRPGGARRRWSGSRSVRRQRRARRRRRLGDRHRLRTRRPQLCRAAARQRPDADSGCGVDDVLRRSPLRIGDGAAAGQARIRSAIVYDVELTLDLPRERERRDRAQRAGAHGRGAVRAAAWTRRRRRRGAHRRAADRRRALPRVLAEGGDREARVPSCLPARCTPVTHSGIAGLGLAHAMAQAVGGRLRAPARCDERDLPAAGARVQSVVSSRRQFRRFGGAIGGDAVERARELAKWRVRTAARLRRAREGSPDALAEATAAR